MLLGGKRYCKRLESQEISNPARNLNKNLERTSFTTTNLLFGITLDTFSRFTKPSSASLIVVWTTKAFLSAMVVSFLGSVVTIWIIMLKSTTTLPFLIYQGTKVVWANSHTVATMITNALIYKKLENRRVRKRKRESISLFYYRARNLTSFLFWLLSCRESECKIVGLRIHYYKGTQGGFLASCNNELYSSIIMELFVIFLW